MKLHGYFKDYAVVQANEELIVTGECAPLSPVCVRIESKSHAREFSDRSDGAGKFAVPCGRYEPGFCEYAITVSCKEERIRVSHVLFGDVYLALGQSNIELRLKYLSNYEKLIAEYGRENFRFLDLENVTVNYNGKGIYGLSAGADDFCGDFAWGAAADGARAAETFGFSYLFCGEMQKKTGYPVAAVNPAVGGSSFANWFPRETIANDPVLSEAYADTLIPAENGQSNAGCIYYEKIRPLKGFAFKGAIWYLGESMAWDGFKKTATILPAMRALFRLYRSELRGGLPTVVMHIGIQSYGGLSVNYANEQFGFACSEIENLAECPLFDLSHKWIRADGNEMYHPIHLVEKREHARRAATLFYENFIAGRKLACPKIASVDYAENGAVCKIANADRLQVKDGKPVYGFALAGGDGKYVTAQARLTDRNEIEVFSPFVKNPKRLTYAFFAYNNFCNVTGNGLPLLPYRSVYENADKLDYAAFLPPFDCRHETFYENAFSALGGGAGFRKSHTVGKLFGDPEARVSYTDDGVVLSMRYCPREACFVGISPEILICDQPHGLDRYDGLCLELTPKKEIEFTGVHFRTCTGEQFYLVPKKNGAEQRNLLLKGGEKTELLFDLNSAVDRKECTFPLSRETRKLIAVMQITFRNRERENVVTIHGITCFYGKDGAPAQAEDNRDKMFRY